MTPLPWHEEIVKTATATPAAATMVIGEPGAGAGELTLALAAKYGGGNIDENNPDVLVIAPEKKIIPVDAPRQIIHFFAMAPIKQQRRIAVIMRADHMNASAANALLKTLEEPRPNRFILLWARSLRRLPATIISRCRLQNAPPPTAAQAQAWFDAQGIKDTDTALLSYCGGQPLTAAQLPPDWNNTVADWMQQGATLNAAAIATAMAKNEEHWLDAVQKWSADGVRAACDLPPRYFPARAAALKTLAASRTQAWLNFYQFLLQRRALEAHPLAKNLVIMEVLNEYKQLCAN